MTLVDFSNEVFFFFIYKVINVVGYDVRVFRIIFVGEFGWELYIFYDLCVRVYEVIIEVGKKFGIVNGGYRVLDLFSVEKGYKYWY